MTQIQETSPARLVKNPCLHGVGHSSPLVFLVQEVLRLHRQLIDAILANESRTLQEHQAAHKEKLRREHHIKV